MGKFSRRPLVVEAFQYGVEEPPDWFTRNLNSGRYTIKGDGLEFYFFGACLSIPRGAYIIKSPRGEIFPCRDDIFHETHTRLNIQGY